MIAPAPLVDADTVTVLVPSGVPGFPPAVFPPPHEVSPDASIRKINRPKSCKPRGPRLPRAANPNIARTGNRTANVGRSEDNLGARRAALLAVVVTASVLLAAAPLGVTEVGLKLHAASAGSPLHEKLTAELNPFCGVTVNVAVPLWPLAMFRVVGFTET